MSQFKPLPQGLTGQLDVLMIDNFDSFTWNLYQSLSLLGADVTVIRNNAISASQLPQLKIKYLIISPGPGHPQTDSGISNAAIKYFMGKVPVLGVCMGLECLVDALGGQIGYAGEIMHGKVSRIQHDNRGCFKDVPQGIRSTRYHSLSAQLSTVPDDLAITATTQESGVIMGVRHRKFTVEAVQYHPESIMSEGGDAFLKNFLSLKGGTWNLNPDSNVLNPDFPPFPVEALPSGSAATPNASKLPSILHKIYQQRLDDVAKAKATPGSTLKDLETLLSLNIAPPLISFVDRLREGGESKMALLAEIKRASPSKGRIAVETSPASQALAYALAGANVISVLTEPKWFLGSLQDMLHARMSVAHLVNRPAVLRKDFILSKYQIIEARIYGADTVLLIVSMLPPDLLKELYEFSVGLGMEPLVEVNNAREMEAALSLKAKVIGVNNRNLHDFNVDMDTTSRLSDMIQGSEVILCALSGISSPEDVQKYAKEGVKAVLIGESLMRAKDTQAFIRELFSLPPPSSDKPAWRTTSPLVKICGIRSVGEATAVASAGADMLGLVFAPQSKRRISLDTAKSISAEIRATRFATAEPSASIDTPNTPWFTAHATRLSTSSAKPLIVGVFQNASLAEILHIVTYVQLDIVQLHGSEPIDWARQIPVPVIRAFHAGKDLSTIRDITRPGAHHFVLLDSMRDDGSALSGGSGKVVDWDLAKQVVERGEFVEGGLVDGKDKDEPAAAQNGETARLQTPPVDSEEPKPSSANPVPTAEEKRDGTAAAASAMTKKSDVLPTPTPTKELNGVEHFSKTTIFTQFPLPVLLAGGLTPDNVASALVKVEPWAVDVSGGVENKDGTGKDLDKVHKFIMQVKGVAAENVEEESAS